MNRSRPLAAAALLLALVAIALFLWWRQPPPPGGPGRAAEGGVTVEAAHGGATADPARAGLPAGPDAAGGRVPLAPPPADEVYTVRGRVLADPRLPVGGAMAVAHRGRAGERPGFLSPFTAMSRPGQELREEDFAFLAAGEPLARAEVAADGSFELASGERHLRLTLEHDYYGLAVPEIVHVPTDTREAAVVLAPYLGGHLRGRLLGPDPAAVAEVAELRLSLEPDPFAAVRDPQGFMGAILQMATGREKPSPDGTFAFRAVVPGAVATILARSDTVVGTSVQPALQPGELREIGVPLVRAAGLAVRVVDEAQAPLADVRVSARPRENRSSLMPGHGAARGRTDAAGTCELRGLLPGRYEIRARARGWLGESRDLDLPAEGPLTITLRRGLALEGIVVGPDGEPVEGAMVAPFTAMEVPILGDVTDQLGLDLLARVTEDGIATDGGGRFEITGIHDEAPFHVLAAHSDFTPGIAREVRAGDSAVRVELGAAGTLTGRVVDDAGGAPVTQFTVAVQTRMFLVVDRPVRTEDVADPDGAFRLTGLGPGSFTLLASAEGYSNREQSVAIEPGAMTDVGEVRLARGAAVAGTVRDEQGGAIAGALVRRVRGGMLDNPVLTMMLGGDVQARSDEQGRFELDGLPPGGLQLVADARGFAGNRSERLEVTAGQRLEGVAIVLDHGGGIDGVLRVGPGERPEDFAILAQEVSTQHSADTVAAPDGTFRIDNLEPGRYQVQAMHPAALGAMQGAQSEFEPGRSFDWKGMMSAITDHTVSQRCVVRSGQRTEVELDAADLGAGVRLHLRITVGGEPLAGGFVEATAADGSLRTGFLEGGETVLGALQPGPLRVQVRSGMTLTPVGTPQDLEVPEGTDRHAATIDLPAASLQGRVVDFASGERLGSVVVRLLRDDAGGDDLIGMAITGDDGTFTFRGLPAGTYGIVAADAIVQRSPEGAASRLDGIELAAAATVTGLELRAAPAAGLTVAVTDGGGAPVPGATLIAVDEQGRPLGAFALMTSGRDGRAHLGGLPRGRVRVVGRAPGLAPGASSLIDVQPGQRADLQLHLLRGTRVVLDAVGRDGLPLAGVDVTARCNGGVWFPALLLVEGRATGSRVELGRLTPGQWEFRLAHPSTGTFTVQRAIQDGATVTVLATPR